MSLTRAGLLAGAGALALTATACRKPQPAPTATRACLLLDGPQAPVGFDATFSITAKLDCPGLGGGRVVWSQIEGPTLSDVAPARDGFGLTARMPPLASAVGGPPPWGVVPVSPRTRGEVVLRATWSDDSGHTVTGDVRVAAAGRSRGLPNTPVGVRVYLGGQGWRITAHPADSRASLITAGGIASLLPDVAGDWRLADGGGRTLALRTGRYDETPLDCGRAGCHPAITDAVAASPMTTVLARLMDQRPAADYPRCAIACHATGEPGAPDGGFAHVVSEMGTAGDLTRRWDALPRDLHRLGGVGCLACHGPGAIPEASARWAVLRADVCATCHDAPPRYGHVVTWRQTAMARADQDPRARRDPTCARCHTTSGFLAAVATPERGPVDRRAPEDAGPVGITCSACHAVHDPRHAQPARRLLRATPTPALLAGATEPSVCLPCHAPDAGDARPSASAAAVWRGRGGIDPENGTPLIGVADHATLTGGCVGCHRGGPENVQRGAGHAFRVPDSVCTPCHPTRPALTDVRGQAKALLRGLRSGESETPPHADPTGGLGVDRRTPRGRAIWNLLLLAEDPAAEVHNPRYARALLELAAKAIAPHATGRTR